MTDIPSTDVIRHWIAWDNDEHDYKRVQLFELWHQQELRFERQRQRQRILSLLEDWINDDFGNLEETLAIIMEKKNDA